MDGGKILVDVRLSSRKVVMWEYLFAFKKVLFTFNISVIYSLTPKIINSTGQTVIRTHLTLVGQILVNKIMYRHLSMLRSVHNGNRFS